MRLTPCYAIAVAALVAFGSSAQAALTPYWFDGYDTEAATGNTSDINADIATRQGGAPAPVSYVANSLDNSNDYTRVEVSANGDAGPWVELTRHQGSGNDGSYVAASHDISAYASVNTRIRFRTSSSMGGSDTVWFDNIEIVCTP